MDPLSALFDALIGTAGAGRRRGPSLHELIGWPLTIVMLGLGGVGAAVFVAAIKSSASVEATFAVLLVPFVGTLAAGLAGGISAWRSLAAASFSTLMAFLVGGVVGVFLAFASIAH